MDTISADTKRFAKAIFKRLSPCNIRDGRIPKHFKPKTVVDAMGQFPYRCPICWQKHLYRNNAAKCLDRCWDALPLIVWQIKEEPDEIDSCQWDIDAGWCGVVHYSDGSYRYYKCVGCGVEFIDFKELKRLLSKGATLHQRGDRPLPEAVQKIFPEL